MVSIFHIDNKFKSFAPIVYSTLFALYIGNNLIFGELLLKTDDPFQYVTFTLSCSIIVNYILIKICSDQTFIPQEIHLIGISFAITILMALLSYKFNVMPYFSIFIIKGWIAKIIYETHLLGEMYSKLDIIYLIGITIGAILCVFNWTFSLLGILLGWIGAAGLFFASLNLKKIKKTKSHIIAQYSMVYIIIILGLIYPVHSFGKFNYQLILFSIINGLLFPLLFTLFLHGIQIGHPAMCLALLMLINLIGGAINLGISFQLQYFLGIVITLFFSGKLLLEHKTHIESGGFEVEIEENPYYELNSYHQRV